MVNVNNSKVCQEQEPAIANKPAPLMKQLAQKVLRMVIPPVLAKEEKFNDIAPAAGPVDWNYHKSIKGGK